MGDVNHEPSMEEILASIKRIIAEDGEGSVPGARRGRQQRSAPPASRPAPAPPNSWDAVVPEEEGEEEGVLELTDRVDPEPTPIAPVPDGEDEVPAAPIRAAPADELAKAEMVDDEEPPIGRAPDPASVAADPDLENDPEEPLVSEPARAAARQSLAALSALVVKPEPGGPDTLEGLVRDMLKPMLKEWLDARLPGLVEQVVRREIARIIDERG